MSVRNTKVTLAPRFKLWLSCKKGEGVFGDGKWRLLDAIQRRGSLKAAAKTLRMSYRKAWGDLRKAERYLNVTLVQKSRGGRTGGGAALTEDGKKWLAAYSRLRADAEKAVDASCRKHMGPLTR